jgi:hypothetical protein
LFAKWQKRWSEAFSEACLLPTMTVKSCWVGVLESLLDLPDQHLAAVPYRGLPPGSRQQAGLLILSGHHLLL